MKTEQLNDIIDIDTKYYEQLSSSKKKGLLNKKNNELASGIYDSQ